MTRPDAKTALYKLLSYAKACFERGVRPDVEDAMRAVDAPPAVFGNVLRMAGTEGLLQGLEWSAFQDYEDQVMVSRDWSITLKGVEYLDANSMMSRVGRTLGGSFASTLASAVAATAARAAGL